MLAFFEFSEDRSNTPTAHYDIRILLLEKCPTSGKVAQSPGEMTQPLGEITQLTEK